MRNLVLALGVLGIFGGIVAFSLDSPYVGFWALFNGVILTIGVAYERRRYKRTVEQAPSSARPTDERFIDPETGKPVRVYFDPATGERSYVQE